jgi:hypothetical protein
VRYCPTINEAPPMHESNWVWVLIPLFAIAAGTARMWIRARHGYPLDRRGVPSRSADEIERLKASIQSRDATIAKLEERVRVLERIATDRPTALREEIERLRS